MFTDNIKSKIELYTTYTGITVFILHLLIVGLIQFGLISSHLFPENLFGHPFCALFSPFSILLIYEVYLLIYYLRKSYTKSLSKQIEIMALILLRNNFKDIGNMIQGDSSLVNSELLKDLTGFVCLLMIARVFNKIAESRSNPHGSLTSSFILLKNRLSDILFWLLLLLSMYSFSRWLIDIYHFHETKTMFQDPSHIFYSEFFTILTLVDVILLLSSAKNLTNAMLVIRNSGYVLSTLLMRISFELSGWERILIILMGASLAVYVLWVCSSKNPSPESSST
jgi:hypothetical protein